MTNRNRIGHRRKAAGQGICKFKLRNISIARVGAYDFELYRLARVGIHAFVKNRVVVANVSHSLLQSNRILRWGWGLLLTNFDFKIYKTMKLKTSLHIADIHSARKNRIWHGLRSWFWGKSLIFVKFHTPWNKTQRLGCATGNVNIYVS